jgi:hypothetical protein
MNSFLVNSYQLAENKKWIPAGKLLEPIGNSNSTNIKQMKFHDKQLDTEDEADKFFIDYYKSKGYIQSESK